MKENYTYPLNELWNSNELMKVINLYTALEEVYEKGLKKEAFEKAYLDFKTVVKSIGEEKQLGKAFFKESGYDLYPVVQLMKHTDKKILKMEVKKK